MKSSNLQDNSENSVQNKEWGVYSASGIKSDKDGDLKKEIKKRGKYEEKLVVDMSFEELIKLSLSDEKKQD